MTVDHAVRPLPPTHELRELISPPWSMGGLPDPLGARYRAPGLTGPEPNLASTPAAIMAALPVTGVEAAVVVPWGLGMLPNPDQEAAVARALNLWVDREFVSRGSQGGVRPLGSIRLPAGDPQSALDELERWADRPEFVQAVLPLRAVRPYGDEYYFPVLEAVSERGLVLGIYDDLATTVEPTGTVGPQRTFIERRALQPMVGFVHVASLITCGVLDRLPGLRILVGDGGADFARPLMWKLDREWQAGRVELPWVTRLPSEYLDSHFRFVSSAPASFGAGLSVFGSQVPLDPAPAVAAVGDDRPFLPRLV